MKLPHRRQFLHLATGGAALPALSRVARAQTYPARPVRLIIGYPPGSGTDIIARLIGQGLSERLGQQFVIALHDAGNGGAARTTQQPKHLRLLGIGSRGLMAYDLAGHRCRLQPLVALQATGIPSAS